MNSVVAGTERSPKLTVRMPARTTWHALISVCVTCVFYAIIVYPVSSRLGRLRDEAEALRGQIKLQTEILPLYARLKAMSELRVLEGLPQPPDGPMLKSDVQNMAAKLSVLARSNRVVLVSAIPQPNLKSGMANLMPVDIVARGRFQDFRGFLLNSSAARGLDSISHLEITRDADRERLEARMWFIVE